MNKRILLLIVFVAAFVFVLLSSWLGFLGKQSTNLPFSPFATPTPFAPSENAPKQQLEILRLSPVDGATNVDINTPIVATFNKNVTTASASFSIFPDIQHSFSSQNNTLTVSPTAPFETGIVYSYSFFAPDGTILKTATFSAGISPSPIVPLTGRFPNLDTVADTAQRENFPDVFLAGYVPYQNNIFSVSSGFSASPSGHYVFSVTPNTATAKQGFLAWLKQLGMTDSQIQQLEVAY